jgi:hypothetical protein
VCNIAETVIAQTMSRGGKFFIQTSAVARLRQPRQPPWTIFSYIFFTHHTDNVALACTILLIYDRHVKINLQYCDLDFYLSKAEATSNGKVKNMTAHRHSNAFFPT